MARKPMKKPRKKAKKRRKCKRCGSTNVKKYHESVHEEPLRVLSHYQCMKCGITDKGIYAAEMWELV